MEPRDLSELSSWRQCCDWCVIEALYIYGAYLFGQSNGMSDSLDLGAVVAACDIEGIPGEDRPDLCQRILMVHARVREIRALKRKK